ALRYGQTATRKLRDHHRDVVFSATLIGQINHALAGRFEIGSVENDFRDLVLMHLSRQAVAANHQRIHVAKRQTADLDVHIAVRAQGLQNDVAIAVGFGLLLGDLSRVNQLLHQRLVFGSAEYLLLTDQVSAAVSDLTEKDMIAHRRDRGEGGAQSLV